MIKGYEYQSDFARRYVAEGRAAGYVEWFIVGYFVGHARGRIEGAARSVSIVLEARDLVVPNDVRERILAEKDPERLKSWLKKAAVASSVAEVVDETN